MFCISIAEDKLRFGLVSQSRSAIAKVANNTVHSGNMHSGEKSKTQQKIFTKNAGSKERSPEQFSGALSSLKERQKKKLRPL